MFTFGASNVTNCEEREISFPLLILSLESKKRHSCETHVASFFISSLISYHSSLFTFFPKSGSTLMKAVTAKVMAQRNMTSMKKEL